MIAPFPHHYVVTYEAGDLAAPPRAPIAAGAPPQFGGSDAMWSPEELLVGAALLCLKTTFDAYARRDKLQIFEWRGRGEGVLDKGREGPIFTDIALDVVLVTRPGDEARARAVLELAEHNCIISRALKTQVKLSIEVTARELREAQALAQ